jgi:hypothetical protein
MDPHSFSTLDPDPHSLKKLDPDSCIVNADTKHWPQVLLIGIILQYYNCYLPHTSFLESLLYTTHPVDWNGCTKSAYYKSQRA